MLVMESSSSRDVLKSFRACFGKWLIKGGWGRRSEKEGDREGEGLMYRWQGEGRRKDQCTDRRERGGGTIL